MQTLVKRYRFKKIDLFSVTAISSACFHYKIKAVERLCNNWSFIIISCLFWIESATRSESPGDKSSMLMTNNPQHEKT